MLHSPVVLSAAKCACRKLFFPPALLSVLVLVATANPARAASATPTTTTLSAPTADLPSGAACTLTATVTASGAPVTGGFVTFFEGAVPLGTAVLHSDGTATLHITLPPGTFSIKAGFNGSNAGAPSMSSPQTVTQLGQSSTSLIYSGGVGEYTLTATVNGNQAVAPAGSVTFKDETTGTVLGQATLTPSAVQSSINSYFIDAYGNAATFGDFNGDGRSDNASMTVAAGSNDSELVVNLANPDGSFTQVVAENYGQTIGPQIVAAADMNGDGLTDLILSQYDSSTQQVSISVLLSDGNGYFTPAGTLSGLTGLNFVLPGDFNGDGTSDLIFLTDGAGGQQQVVFSPGDGAGNLGPIQTSNIGNMDPFVAADFNRDGNLDMILDQGPADYAVYLGQGNGTTFTAQPTITMNGAATTALPIVADFNGDGIPDLAISDGTSTVTVLLGDGKGNFTPAPNGVTNIGTHTFGSGLAMDVNGDGIMDLVFFVQDHSGSELGESGNDATQAMLVLIGDGTGHFTVSSETQQAAVGSLSYPNSTVPFTFPALGSPLIVPTPPVGISTATISNVNLTGAAGFHSIVAIYNGNDVLPGSTSQPITLGGDIDLSQGFTAGSVQSNGSATQVGSAMQLTTGQPNQTGSFFYPQQVDIRGFVTDFDFQLTNAQADGFTFTIQTASPQALGGTGGSLGYAGIPNSVAIKFDLFNNAGEGSDSTGMFTNGAMPTVPATDLTSTGIDLHSGHVLHARIIYGDYNDLKVILSDATTGKTAEQDYTINLSNALGGNTAFVGFTGSTGGLTATQQILNWTYSPLPDYVLELPAPQGQTPYMTAIGLAMNGPARIITNYNELRLIDSGVANQASSAYFTTPVDIRKFTTDFTFQATNAIADGFTFVLQNAGLTAVGPSGGGLGYGPDTPYGGVGGGIPKSVAIKFDFYSNVGEGTDSTGLYLNGASPTLPATDLSATGVTLTSHDILHAHMVYDGTTLTLTITDTATGAAATESYAVNIPAAVGANTALAGFTAGTGALSAQENILTWTYEPTN